MEAYIESQHTYFVLESLETLKKNGRLTGIKALVASALNIKPIMGSTPEGSIQQLGQTRGIKKALLKMIDQLIEDGGDTKDKILAISHCNCKERAEEVKKTILAKSEFKDVILVDTAGISSMYASDGGVIMVV